jgi:hypothetical protein
MTDALSNLLPSRVGSAVAGGALAYGALWISLRNLGQSGFEAWIFWVPVTLLLVTISALCWWYSLRGHYPESRAAMGASWQAGWLVGCIGGALGFIGPLVIWPEANLGPLLGILFTGPAGFVLGVIGAVLVRTARAA